MIAKTKQEAQQPLILRAHRLMEAFAKSDDERDFYLDRMEGFIIYVDLDKPQTDIETLEKELLKNPERYCMIPKLTFYETKKIMEGFVNEKVYDIDTKEKLLDIIQSKEARNNFLEFIYDHLTELEKWQQYYQERSRIRIIEWLRNNHFHFVFEEDLELARSLLEKLKQSLYETKVGKDVVALRKLLVAKAKSYYSNEALNPRPKRGRPPKQVAKQEIEPQTSRDVYLTVPPVVRPFLFSPEISSASAITFASDFETPEVSIARRQQAFSGVENESLQQKLASLRKLSSRWVETEKSSTDRESDFDDDDDEDEEFSHKNAPVKKSAKKQKIESKKKPKADAQPKISIKSSSKKSPKKHEKPAKPSKVKEKKPPLRSILRNQDRKVKTSDTEKRKPKKRIIPQSTAAKGKVKAVKQNPKKPKKK